MKYGRQHIVWSGLFVASSFLLAASQSAAFGQQWRPATQGYMPAQPAVASVGYRRVANIPSFRPQVASSQSRQGLARYSSASPRTLNSRPDQRSLRFANAQPQPRLAYSHPQPYMQPPAYRYAPAYQQAPTAWGMPAWMNPFAQMAQPWQYAAPPFPRQFAYQPAQQPQATPRSFAREPGLSAAYGGYRSAQGMRSAAAYDLRSRTAQTGYNAGSMMSSRGYRPVPRVAASFPSVQTGRYSVAGGAHSWRPAQPLVAAAQSPRNDFRPFAYGRSAPGVEFQSAQPRVAADKLPGWVTTYQEPQTLLDCDWCSGS